MAGVEKVFMSIGRIGKLDEKGKVSLCYMFKGRAEAGRNDFLATLVPGVVHALLSHLGHTSFEAAQKDLENLKAEVKEMRLLPNATDQLAQDQLETAKPEKPKRKRKKN